MMRSYASGLFVAKSTLRRLAIAGVALTLMGALAACAPQQATEGQELSDTSSEAEGAGAMEGDFTFSMDADCVVCHTNEGSSMDDTACLVGTADHESMTCFSCHDDEAALTDAHANVAFGDKEPKRLKSTTVDAALCESCHNADELVAKTAESTVLTDNKGTVVNPHAVMGLNEDHSEINCLTCHEAHGSDPVSETAPDACSSCHHTNVYERHTCHD